MARFPPPIGWIAAPLMSLSPTNSTVYVVDDDPDVLGSLRFLLETDGFEVRTFRSAAALLSALASSPADCFVIDYKMPGMDGLDTARGIRGRRAGQVMILYTAYIDETLERQAAEAGISLCIGKVDGLASLEREINRLCASLF